MVRWVWAGSDVVECGWDEVGVGWMYYNWIRLGGLRDGVHSSGMGWNGVIWGEVGWVGLDMGWGGRKRVECGGQGGAMCGRRNGGRT